MRTIPNRRTLALAIALGTAALASGCGGGSGDAPATAATAPSEVGGAVAAAPTKLISVQEAAARLEQPPAGLVVLDVRTPEEFATGHLPGATLIDFSAPDFATEIGRLDRAAPYLVYCRSGNRSGQAVAAMAALGFTDVTDVDGGIAAWSAARLPLVQP